MKIESERKEPQSCQNCGLISIGWYPDSKSNVRNQNFFSNISDKVRKPSYLDLHDWRFLFTERLESITKSNFFPRTTVKGLQQYRGESTSKTHRLVNISSISSSPDNFIFEQCTIIIRNETRIWNLHKR